MTTSKDGTDQNNRILSLARRFGLSLQENFRINEMGLDYQVVIGVDEDNQQWVLRIPRRPGMSLKVAKEANILEFVKGRIPVSVPDWQIANDELIAYPYLKDKTAIDLNPRTHEVTWNIDQDSLSFVKSLANLLVQLHAVSPEAAMAAGIECLNPEAYRQSIAIDLDRVKREIGIGSQLESECRIWLDTDRLWPDFSVFVHGELYVGHVLVDDQANITGVIDWSEAQVSDPATDFAAHLAAFGEAGLNRLIREYEICGGRTWPTMAEHTLGLSKMSPVKYGLFALNTENNDHLQAAKAQLGV